MNKRSGFTLMELLLVVAVLAIVAAAAVPTFFGGAAEAMKEARKSRIASAYTNLFSQANMAASVAMAKGDTVTAGYGGGNCADWPTTSTAVLPHPDGSANTVTLTVGWVAAEGVTITGLVTGGAAVVIGDLEAYLKTL